MTLKASILIVEDEPIVALDIENTLEIRIELGYLTHGSSNELAKPSISTMIAN